GGFLRRAWASERGGGEVWIFDRAADLDRRAARERERRREPVAAHPVGARDEADQRRARSVRLDRFDLQREIVGHLIGIERERLQIAIERPRERERLAFLRRHLRRRQLD